MLVNPNDVWAESMPLLPAAMDSVRAKASVFAIGFQESEFLHRRQMENGPARGFWQFERGGGTHGVLTHPGTTQIAKAICRERNVAPNAMDVWTAFETDDILACCFARLLLYTAPWPLPGPGEHEEGWRQYLWCWRPGRPHPEKFPGNYAKAWELVG